MKHAVNILLSLALILSLAACQPTPEKGVVVQKNQERMLEDAQRDPAATVTGGALAEQYGIPAEYAYEAQNKDGNITVQVNAPVYISAGNRMPIYRVKATDFTQQQVNAMWDALVGDAKMYDDDGAPCVATLKDTPVFEQGEYVTVYSGLSASERGRGKTFSVKNNYDLTEVVYVGERVYNLGRMAQMHYTDRSISEDIAYESAFGIARYSDAELTEMVGISPSQALAKVQDVLDAAGGEMGIHQTLLLRAESTNTYMYQIDCVRIQDGIPVAFVPTASASGGRTDAVASYWNYETMRFGVGGGGISFMAWTSPLEVLERVNEDAQLKPFSEIQEIFEKMIFIMYEARIDYEGLSSFHCEIDRVELTLQRIAEQNSHENGLLVPVWNFYRALPEMNESIGHSMPGESAISINAIDGTIIDVREGY